MMGALPFRHVRIAVSVMVLCAAIGSTCAYALQTGDEIFALTDFDKKRNTYATFAMTGHRSTAFVVVGEFALLRSPLTQPLLFDFKNGRRAVQSGLVARGLDAQLSSMFTTEPFIPSIGDTLRFFREAGIDASDHWAAVPGDIDDTTTLVIRIEDIYDGTVYVDVDSVVMLPNANDSIVPHFGTNVERNLHAHAVPSMLAGRTVHVRLLFSNRSGGHGYSPVAEFEEARIAYSVFGARSRWPLLTLHQVDSLDQRYQSLLDVRQRAQTVDNRVGTDSAYEYQKYIREHHSDTSHYYIVGDSGYPNVKSYHFKDFVVDSINAMSRRRAERSSTDGKPVDYAVLNKFSSKYRRSSKQSRGRIKSSNSDTAMTIEPMYVRNEIDYTTNAMKNGNTTLLSMDVRVIDMQQGALHLGVHVPPNTSELRWSFTDEDGVVIKSGLLWPQFKGAGPLTLPYLPVTKKAYSLQLVDIQNGTVVTRQFPANERP